MKRKVRTVLSIGGPGHVKHRLMDWGLGEYVRRWEKMPEATGLSLQQISSYPNQTLHRFRFWDSTEPIDSSPDCSLLFHIKSIFVS